MCDVSTDDENLPGVMGQCRNPDEAKAAMTFVPVSRYLHRPQFSPPTLGLKRFYIYICLLIIFIMVLLLIRTVTNMRVIFVQYHTSSDTDGELLVLPENFAQLYGAYCLDGSPPGFYIRYGKSPNVNKWILHLPGGAWCSSVEDCYSRSFTELGSSAEAPMFRAFGGILSRSEKENPDFHMWNMVDFLYCDGGSFTGNRSTPISHRSKKLYLQGFAVFNAIVNYLLEHTQMSAADQVILSGSSAGGIAATVNADYLRKKLNNVMTLHVVVDGSLFLDHPNQEGDYIMGNIYKNVFYLHNVQGSASIQECTSRVDTAAQWICLQPSQFYKYLFTPAFFINSLYDTWFMKNSLGVSCPFSACKTKDISILNNHKKLLLHSVEPIISAVHDGIYLTSCPVHMMLVDKRFSISPSDGELSAQKALSKWYFHEVQNSTFMENIDFTQAISKCQISS